MWQPIETAPKDGTRIYVHGFWDERATEHSRGKRHTCIGSWCTYRPDGVIGFHWIYEGILGNRRPEAICVTFTHWMPLPEPPTDEQLAQAQGAKEPDG